MSQGRKNNDDPRYAEMLEVIFKYAAGDLKARGTLVEDDSALDGVMAGINILGEELDAYIEEKNQANELLRQALDLAQALIRSSPDGILAVDRDLRITEWNLLMEQIAGLSMEQIYGRDLNEIPFMNDTGEAARIRAGLEASTIEPKEIAYVIPTTAEQRFFESIMAPLLDSAGQNEGAVLRIRDITERKRAEEQLRSASLYARSLLEASLDPLATISVIGVIMDVNEAASLGTGVPRELLVGSDFSAYFTEPDMARAAYEQAFTTGSVMNYPLVMRHVSGRMTEVLYNASLYRDERGDVAGVLAVARDVTERRRAERAEELASRDSLTHLYNHRTFYSLLNDEISRTRQSNRPMSLLLLDIDHFKRVNDTHGHLAGDAILHSLSDLLVNRARAVDIVCRYGGEEFMVILPETRAPVAMKIAERLRTEVERRPFDIGGRKRVSVTVSIGVATYSPELSSPDGMVNAADRALYAAKRGGRNRVQRYESKPAAGS